MYRLIRISFFLLSFFATVLFVVSLAAKFEKESCLDASGSYNHLTGFCKVSSGQDYIAQLARPNLFLFWSLFLAISLLPGYSIYKSLNYLLNRLTTKKKENNT